MRRHLFSTIRFEADLWFALSGYKVSTSKQRLQTIASSSNAAFATGKGD